ncbi:hypothetical protein [Thermoactinospora rubra]|uniref:hypothetical protein n=1 Tax=Thermoactinospora rubra TaxID=1088767 RepID=UPI00117C6384|nr:hypothetical protein [Thermoactinospora rubra]
MADDLRQRYAEALLDARWHPRRDEDRDRVLDALVAVRDEELERLRAENTQLRADIQAIIERNLAWRDAESHGSRWWSAYNHAACELRAALREGINPEERE